MRIFMIGQKGMPAIYGGVERHVHELSVRLVKLGHMVTVYSRKWYTQKPVEQFCGVKIKTISTLHTKHLDAIIHSLLCTIHAIKNQPDVIHYHGVGPSLVSWIPRLFAPKIKVITTFHSIDRKHEKWGFLAKMILHLGEWTACKFAEHTIAVSQTIAQYCRDVYDTDAIFIPNGVPDYEKEKSYQNLFRFRLKPQNYLLALSRLIPHKGMHYLILAFQKLQKLEPKLVKDLKLAIVGDGYYTEKYVAYLKKLAKGDQSIVFTGFRAGPELGQLISHAKLMIHPSDNEGTPITVLEGMSYGLPVLLSDIPEHKELIKDDEFLFAHGNIDALTEKLSAILKMRQYKLQQTGMKNKKFVQKEYNWENITKKIVNIYQLEPKRKILNKTVLAVAE